MNKITMIYKEDDAKTVIEREIQDDANIYFAGRAFYEFLKGIGFSDCVIENVLITDGLYDV